jgi:integrase
LFVENAKAPPEGRIEYADEVTTGLHLRVGARGHKSWSAVFRIGARKGRMTLGTFPAISLSDARKLALEVIGKAQTGDDPVAERREKEARYGETVEKVGRAWIELHCKPNNRSWRFQERQLELYVFPTLGSRAISALRRRDIIELMDDIVAKGQKTDDDQKKQRVGGATASDNVLRLFRAMLNWAVARDKLSTNPASGIRVSVKPKPRERSLTDKEIKTVWDGASKLGYPFGTHLLLCLLTGQRRTEVAEMRWDEIDGDTWVIPSHRTKSKRPHVVPITDAVRATLDACPTFNGGSFVLSTTNGKRPISGFSKAKTESAIAVADWRCHDLRRTAATGMAKSGVMGEIISRILNHAPPSGVTNAHYNKYDYLSEKRHALELWGEAVLGIVSQAGDGGGNRGTTQSAARSHGKNANAA